MGPDSPSNHEDVNDPSSESPLLLNAKVPLPNPAPTLNVNGYSSVQPPMPLNV